MKRPSLYITIFILIIVAAGFSYTRVSFQFVRAQNVAALKAQLQNAPELSGKYRQEGTSLVLTNAPEADLQVAIGSPDEREFKPELTMSKWDGEVKFKISPALDVAESFSSPSAVSLKDDKVQFTSEKIDYRMYEVSPSSPSSSVILSGSEGSRDSSASPQNDKTANAFEFDAVLKEKPETNVFKWAIETENLDFFYQPPLNEENIAPASGTPSYDKGGQGEISCTETECKDKDGNTIIQRPENIVGSYAVYYKGGKTGDYTALGGKNYGTGKAFHIYRPLITDAAGNKVWGVLNITEGVISVTVPQEFLDKAIYPVIVDPTFGYESAGGSDASIGRRAPGTYVTYTVTRVGNTYSSGGDGKVYSMSAWIRTDDTPIGTPTTLGYFLNDEDSAGVGSHGLVAFMESSAYTLTNSYTKYTIRAANEAIVNDNYILNAIGNPKGFAVGQDIFLAYDNTGDSRNIYSEMYSASSAGDIADFVYAHLKENPWTDTLTSTARQYSIYVTYSVPQAVVKSPDKTGLVGEWKFDEGSGLSAGDSSGNHNNGTITGATWTNGKRGKALSFDGTSGNHVSIGTNLDISALPFVVSAWVKPTGDYKSYWRKIFSKRDSYNANDMRFDFELDNGTGHVKLHQEGGSIDFPYSPPTDVWTHLLVVARSGATDLYVNGVLFETQEVEFTLGTDSAAAVAIGATELGDDYFLGSIDDVRIYNRALSPAEILKLYQSGQATINASTNTRLTDGLVGLWSFNGQDISGNTAYDRSGSSPANNGTIVGATPTAGKLGQGMNFDGNGDVVSITDSGTSPFDITSAVTLSAWVKINQYTNDYYTLVSKAATGNGNYWLGFLNNTWILTFFSGSWHNLIGSTLATGRWYHVAGVIDSDNNFTKIYVNGQLDNQDLDETANMIADDNSVTMGDTTLFPELDGILDDVRIYNRALSEDEIKQLYQMGNATIINQ